MKEHLLGYILNASTLQGTGKTLFQSVLELYRPVSLFTDPRSLVPFASFSFPLQWPTVQQRILQELGSRHSSA